MVKNKQLKETLRISDDFPINVFFCKIESNTAHWHPEFEILWLLDGELNVQIDKTEYIFQKEGFALINPYQIHLFKRHSGTNTALIAQINSSFLEKWFPDLNRIKFNYLFLNEENNNNQYNELKKYLKTILHIMLNPQDTYLLELIITVQQFFLSLLQQKNYTYITDREWKYSSENQLRLQRIKNYIDQHLDKKITLENLAKQVHRSTTYISHFFSENMGITFQKYLKMKRLEKAYHQLVTTKQKIIDISLDCGFSNQQTLSTAFKEEFCLSPIQVRKKARYYPDMNSLISEPTQLENNYYPLSIKEVIKILART